MKYILKSTRIVISAFLFTILFIPQVNAQSNLPFAPIGAKWWYTLPNYITFPQLPISYTIMESIGDTVIQGINASKLMFTYSPPDYQYCYGLDATFYMYSDSNRVFLFNSHSQVFNLLYDFNVNAGDSWYIKLSCDSAFFPWWQSDSILITVDSISYINVNNHQLKVLHTNAIGPIIEQIGMVWEPFPQIIYCSGFQSEACASTLRCYEDTVIGFYQSPDSIACDSIYFVGVNEITGIINFLIYPTPAKEILNLEIKVEKNFNKFNVVLTNVVGEIVKILPLNNSSENIDISDLSNGMYFLSVKSQDYLNVTKKFVINR